LAHRVISLRRGNLVAFGLKRTSGRVLWVHGLAEAGCSANEIAAISGHATLSEVQRYTKAADQARMARNAMARQSKTEKEAANWGGLIGGIAKAGKAGSRLMQTRSAYVFDAAHIQGPVPTICALDRTFAL